MRAVGRAARGEAAAVVVRRPSPPVVRHPIPVGSAVAGKVPGSEEKALSRPAQTPEEKEEKMSSRREQALGLPPRPRWERRRSRSTPQARHTTAMMRTKEIDAGSLDCHKDRYSLSRPAYARGISARSMAFRRSDYANHDARLQTR